MYSQGSVTHRADIAGRLVESEMWESGLIYPRVVPSIIVDSVTGEYPRFKLLGGNMLKRELNLRRAPGANSARGDLAYEWDNYNLGEYSFEIPLDRVNRLKTEDYFDAAEMTARMAKRKLSLEREIRAAALTFNETNYGTATNSSVAYTVANKATFDVASDIDAAKLLLLGKGEASDGLTAIMSQAVFNRIKLGTLTQNRLRGIGIASDTILNLDEQAVAEAFGLREIIVGRNYYDSALEGVAYSGSAIWNNTYIWVGRLASGGNAASMLGGGAQVTIVWGKFGPETGVFEYEEPQTKSVIYGVEQYLAEKVINANVGTLIASQYS